MIYVQVLQCGKRIWNGLLPAIPRQGDHVHVSSTIWKVDGVHWDLSSTDPYGGSQILSRQHGLESVKLFVSGPFS